MENIFKENYLIHELSIDAHVKMPKMDCLLAIKEIRRQWPTNGPKIIAITPYALSADREKCLEAGMDDYIAKQVKIDTLGYVHQNAIGGL